MKRNFHRLMLVLMVGVVTACDGDNPPEAPQASTIVAALDSVAADTVTPADTLAVSPGMPLRAIMNGMSVDMAGLSQALWVEDYVQLAERADALANHAEMMPTESERIEAELGDEMAAFEEIDEAVHLAAQRMVEAAGARDLDALMDAREEVQRGCVACHNTFRVRLRSVQPAGTTRSR